MALALRVFATEAQRYREFFKSFFMFLCLFLNFTTMPLLFKYVIAWFPMVIIAILNGSLRQFTYGTIVNELLAHQISTLTGIILFGFYIYFITKKWKLESSKQAIIVGLIWLGMTILFEFVFGHYVMGNSWQKLFHDYNLFAGRIWILILLWTAFAPYVFFRLHKD